MNLKLSVLFFGIATVASVGPVAALNLKPDFNHEGGQSDENQCPLERLSPARQSTSEAMAFELSMAAASLSASREEVLSEAENGSPEQCAARVIFGCVDTGVGCPVRPHGYVRGDKQCLCGRWRETKERYQVGTQCNGEPAYVEIYHSYESLVHVQDFFHPDYCETIETARSEYRWTGKTEIHAGSCRVPGVDCPIQYADACKDERSEKHMRTTYDANLLLNRLTTTTTTSGGHSESTVDYNQCPPQMNTQYVADPSSQPTTSTGTIY